MNRFKKSYYFYGIIVSFLSITFHVYTVSHKPYLEPNLPQLAVSYIFQQDTQNNSIQFPSVEQSNRSSSSSQYSYGSFEYKQFLYKRSGSVTIAQHKYPVTREDFDVIQKICLDNPNYDKDVLLKALLQSSIINESAMLMKNDQPLHCFNSDIYINPEHFKQLANTQQRLKLLKKSAEQAMYDRHKREKSQLESTHKLQLKNAKKKSKTEENKVVSQHKKESAELETKHKQEKKHPLGIKQPKKSVVGPSQSQTQAIQQASPQQITKKSNIASQEIQKEIAKQDQSLREQNKNLISRGQDNSFQKVMDQRSKSFEASIKNPTISNEKISINVVTAGFLQAQGIDTTQFQQVEGLPIQHQLTHELVEILDAVADYAQQHQYEIYQTHLTKYCAHLASLSQQSNIEGALEQAIDGTNCCHGIQHYLEGMVSGIAQAYQQFQTALDYFDVVADTYGNLILQHGAQGAIVAYGLDAIVAAGMIAAPTATVAATGIMIGATAYVMAPLCAQAMIDTSAFGAACITGNWDKITSDLDNFNKLISKPETVGRMAELAGGAAMPTPNLSYVVDQVLSLRPVITSVQNASGEMAQSLYLMTKNQLQKVYAQGVELLQLPEFMNFNISYKKICGFNFFDILPKSHPALIGMETGLLNSGEQAALTNLFTQAEESVVGNIVKSGTSYVGSQVIQPIEQVAETFIAEQIQSLVQLHEVLQQEIVQTLKQPIVSTDLTAKITDVKAIEFANLTPKIRQLQDLAKYTDNFKNLENLIPEDILYLNRIYELQSYRAQIKNFLDIHKPYFMYDGQKYFIEDIASYHIHAADYFRKDAPKGGHSNYGGHKLDYFKPTINKQNPIGAKEVRFYNSRYANKIKDSSIYPETWSEYMCDLKAIAAMTNSKAVITKSEDGTTLEITGYSIEGLEIKIFYDIAKKRIKSHYPDSERF